MTDELLIKNFLNKTFNIIYVTGSFIYKDSVREIILNPKQCADLLYKVFYFDQSKITDYLNDWRSEKEKIHLKDLLEYLDTCKIVDGKYDWLVFDSNNLKITEKYMLDKFKDNYSKFEIIHFYQKWRDEKILKICEKIFGEY